jgi:exosortase/archaeosortase family protein
MSLALNQIPQSVKTFLFRSVLLFAGWKLLYVLWLQPINIPDSQLTALIVSGSTKLLSLFYPAAYYIYHTIFTSAGKGVRVEDHCNGLEVMVLYAGFIIAMPTIKKNIWRKVAYLVGGVVVIFLLNIIRCASLTWIIYNHKDLFVISHKYVFSLVVYGAMAGMWVIYCKDRRYVA